MHVCAYRMLDLCGTGGTVRILAWTETLFHGRPAGHFGYCLSCVVWGLFCRVFSVLFVCCGFLFVSSSAVCFWPRPLPVMCHFLPLFIFPASFRSPLMLFIRLLLSCTVPISCELVLFSCLPLCPVTSSLFLLACSVLLFVFLFSARNPEMGKLWVFSFRAAVQSSLSMFILD